MTFSKNVEHSLVFIETLSIIRKIPLNSIWFSFLLHVCVCVFVCCWLWKEWKFSEIRNLLRKFNKSFVTKIPIFSDWLSHNRFWMGKHTHTQAIQFSLHDPNKFQSSKISKQRNKISLNLRVLLIVVVKMLLGAWSSFKCNKTPLTNV